MAEKGGHEEPFVGWAPETPQKHRPIVREPIQGEEPLEGWPTTFQLQIGKTDSPDHRLIRIFPSVPDEMIDSIYRINEPKEAAGTPQPLPDERINSREQPLQLPEVIPPREGIRGIIYVAQVKDRGTSFTEVDVWVYDRKPRDETIENKDPDADKIAKAAAKKIGELELLSKQGFTIVPTIKDFTDRTTGKLIKTKEEQTKEEQIEEASLTLF